MYRAVDSSGNTLDFLLTARRDAKVAKRFLRKVMQREHVQTPRVINTDKNGSYVKAIAELKQSGELPKSCKHRPVKYLQNQNIVEQDHRFVRWRVKASQHFKNFWSAQRTLRGKCCCTEQLHLSALWDCCIKTQELRQVFVTHFFVATEPFR